MTNRTLDALDTLGPTVKPDHIGDLPVLAAQGTYAGIPAFIVYVHDGHAYWLQVQRGYDAAIAEALLRRVHDALDGSFVVLPGPVGPFDRVALLDREDARFTPFNGRVRELHPLHAGEIPADADEERFRALVKARRPVVQTADWAREPTVFVESRLCTDWPGGSLRKRKAFGHTKPTSIPSWLEEMPLEGRLEMRDARGRTLIAVVDWDHIRLTHDDRQLDVPVSRIAATVDAFLAGEDLPETLPGPVPPRLQVVYEAPSTRRSIRAEWGKLVTLERAHALLEALPAEDDAFLVLQRHDATLQFTRLPDGRLRADVPVPVRRGSFARILEDDAAGRRTIDDWLREPTGPHRWPFESW
jgi:hypothetical protein